MKRNKIIFMLSGSFLFFLTGYFLSRDYDCGYSVFCYKLFSRVGDPLFYGMGALSIVFVALLLAPWAINNWKKFALWYVPMATLLFIFYPEPGSGDLFSPHPEQIFIWTSSLYILISLFLIAYKRFKNS